MTEKSRARQEAIQAGYDIRLAVLRTLAAHGVEFARVTTPQNIADEFTLHFEVFEEHQINPAYVEAVRVSNQLAVLTARQQERE